MNRISKAWFAVITWVTVAALLVSSGIVPVFAATLCGDVTGDGQCDARDALALYYAVTGNTEKPDKTIGDTDGNGTVDMVDALALYAHASEGAPLTTATTTQTTATQKTTTTTKRTTTTTKVTTTTKNTTTTTAATSLTPIAHANRYGRKQLVNAGNTAMVNAYDELHRQISACQTQVNLYDYGLTIPQAQRVIRYYRDDHPEAFWLTLSYSYRYSGSTFYDAEFDCSFTASQIAAYKSKLASATKEMLSGITTATPVAERARIIHNRLIQRAQYDQSYTGSNSHNLLGVLVDKTGVCESYAFAYEYLLHQCGIQAGVVVGQARGIGHMWNIAYIGGKWYHTDVTWDDPVITSQTDWSQYYTYTYFNTTTEHILVDRQIQKEYSVADSSYAVSYSIPGCTATTENYQLKTATSLSSYNAATIAPILAAAIKNDAPAIFRATGGYSAATLETALKNDMGSMIYRINSYLSAADRLSSAKYITKVNSVHNTLEIFLA